MKFTQATLAVATVFGLAISSANAGIVPVITEVTSVFNAPDTALTGHTAYQIDVMTDDQALISAVDAAFSGMFHQRWSDTNFDGIPDPTPQGPPANGRGDSHLTPAAGALIGANPTEDNNDSQSVLPDAGAALDYGYGTTITGAWGIPGASQAQTANVAYIVIPDGERGTFEYSIATSTGTFSGSATFGGIEIPEPTSLALFGLGMVGFIGRRRRNG